jgi:CheY-like chemotaxis protein
MPLAEQPEWIFKSAQHLLALLHDVLHLFQIESGKLDWHMERINLAQVLDHVLALKAIRAQAKGLPLIVHEGAQVPQHCRGDATRLSQILINLISNAVKFTDEGHVDIRLDYAEPELTIEVADTGMGMSPDKVESLFKPFARPAQPGGTGLGLAITKRLVDMMDGRIQVKSELGAGSVFKVTLPLRMPEAGEHHGLRSLALVGAPSLHADALRASLQSRKVHVALCPDLPEVNELEVDTIVLPSKSLPHTDASLIRRHLLKGRAVIVHAPAGTAVDLPAGLHNDLLVMAGPLCPLRLLNALRDRRARPLTVPLAQRLSGLRILVAEDNPVNRLVLQQMLEQEGAALTFAFDGAQALEQVRIHGQASFDLMLCDIQMPVMDGYQAAQALRHMAPGLPIVGLTAHALDTAKQQARDAGMVGYVTKPYMLGTLVDEIRRYARPRSATHPVAQASRAQPYIMSAANSSQDKPQEAAQDASDWEAMQQYFSAQPHLLDRLIGMLTNTLSEIQVELDQAVSNQNMDALAKVAHNVKGTALNLHTPKLADLAIQTQDQAKRQAAADAIRSAELLSARLGSFIAKANQQQAAKVGSTTAAQ